MNKQIGGAASEAFFKCYALPLLLFLALTFSLHLLQAFFVWDHPAAPWWQQAPELWVLPLQSMICAAYLWHVRKGIEWNFTWSSAALGALLGTLGIACWLLPYLGGYVDTRGGFEPERILGAGTWICNLQYALRLARALIIVPIVEELFWRGFLMRYCINRVQPQQVPFGTPSLWAYIVSTAGFVLAHRPQDYAAALIFASLAYILCIYRKSLAAVVIMHACANLWMGLAAILLGLSNLW